MARRLLIVVIDGATLEVAGPLMAAGRMPVLAALRTGGRAGVMRSTVPPLTPPAFASIFTGVGPGRHGVFDFFGHAEGDFLERPPVDASDIEVPVVWQWLAAAGLEVGLVHLPMTWPAPPGVRFVVSSQPGARGVRPRGLGEELERVAPGHLEVAPGRWRGRFGGAGARAMVRAEELRQRAALHVARSRTWDVLAIGVKSTDAVAHGAWADHDPSHPAHRSGAIDRVALEYQRADRFVGELRAIAPDADLLLLSDHGHGPCTRTFGVNRWLMEAGFLRVKARYEGAARSLARYRWLRARRRSGWATFGEMGDWERTRAYGGTGTEQGIYLNIPGRGRVSGDGDTLNLGEEREATLCAVLRRLESATFPGGGARIRCTRREDVLHGPHIERAPELFLSIDGGRTIAREGLRPGPLFRDAGRATGTHRPEGMVILAGPDVPEGGGVIEGARVEDAAPTIAAFCGVPVPAGLDGRALVGGEIAEMAERAERDGAAGEAGREAEREADANPRGGGDAARIRRELEGWGYLGE